VTFVAAPTPTGRALYQAWRARVLVAGGTEPGDWDADLRPTEREAWAQLAALLAWRHPPASSTLPPAPAGPPTAQGRWRMRNVLAHRTLNH
jgi:hypothetical protein